MKYGVFAVPFSDNLGDGIIYDCLAGAIERLEPGAQVVPVDISGRTTFSETSAKQRQSALNLIRRLPPVLRQAATFAMFGVLKRRALTRHLGEAVRQVDAAIIGGGHLFLDASLNFPIKLQLLSSVVPEAMPVAVFAVGASSKVSRPGRALFVSTLRRLKPRFLSARDPGSAQALAAYSDLSAQVVRDPGVLAAWLFPFQRAARDSRRVVGLNVIGEAAIDLDLGSTRDRMPVADLFKAVALTLAAQGCSVRLMTNGAAEDEAALDAIMGDPDIAGHAGIVRSPRPQRPVDIFRAIADLDGLVSHRLHANIVAYSYGVPSVGLLWDDKVARFFESVDRQVFCLTPDRQIPLEVLSTIASAMAAGVDPEARTRVIEQARDDVATMLAALGST